MGWANCGTDSKGRPIGYGFEAVCDHPECKKEIDRGLAYACGGMHREDEYSCENYFCEDHREPIYVVDRDKWLSVCFACKKFLMKEDPDNFKDDEDEVIDYLIDNETNVVRGED